MLNDRDITLINNTITISLIRLGLMPAYYSVSQAIKMVGGRARFEQLRAAGKLTVVGNPKGEHAKKRVPAHQVAQYAIPDDNPNAEILKQFSVDQCHELGVMIDTNGKSKNRAGRKVTRVE